MMQGLLTARPQYLVHYCRSFTLFSFFFNSNPGYCFILYPVYLGGARGEIYEPFMRLKSQVKLTPPRPGQLGRQWGRLNQTQLLRVQKLHLVSPAQLFSPGTETKQSLLCPHQISLTGLKYISRERKYSTLFFRGVISSLMGKCVHNCIILSFLIIEIYFLTYKEGV